MEFTIESQGGQAVCQLRGVLTFDDHDKFKSVVRELTGHDASELVLDLAGLKMIDSAGIGMLLLMNDRASKGGKSLRLTGVTGTVAKVIELSKVDQLIPVSS